MLFGKICQWVCLWDSGVWKFGVFGLGRWVFGYRCMFGVLECSLLLNVLFPLPLFCFFSVNDFSFLCLIWCWCCCCCWRLRYMKKVGFFCVFGFVKERKVLFCVFCFGFCFLEFWRGCDMAVFLVRLLSSKGRSFFGFFFGALWQFQ